MGASDYSVYILRCADDSYYTGIAVDVARRVNEHESSPRGAKYLKGRRPLTLVYAAAAGDRSKASQLEYRVKQLSRAQKEALISGSLELRSLLPAQDPGAG